MASETEELTCYTFKFSPFVYRVEIALKEKGIPYKAIVVEDLSNKPKGLLEANPLWKCVPTITHRGGSVAESRVILEYLEDAFPEKNPLMPADALAKAKVRFWADYVEKGWTTLRNGLIGRANSDPEAVPKLFKTLNDAMLEYSAEGPFFTGNKFGFLDVFLGPIVCLFKVTEVTYGPIPGPEEIPRFQKWVEAVTARKSFSDVVPSNEAYLEYFRGLQQKMAAKAAAQT